jgi:PAS domain S-box-containing protein
MDVLTPTVKTGDRPMDDVFVYAPIGFYRFTQDGRVLQANPALVHMLGYRDLAALKAARVSDFFADASEYTAWRDQLDRDWVVRRFQAQWRRVDGTPIWVEDNARSVETPDGVCYEGAVSDITDAKRMERQFYQAQKMEAIGRLAGGISHDFNNLLTAILGYADLVLAQLPRDHALRDDVDGIRKAAESASSLTRQLVAFSRRQVLAPKVLDLSAVVHDTERLLARVIGEDVELRLTLDERAGRVKVDPSQIEQVLMNLAVNARDAMSHGGKLTLETAAIEFTEPHADGLMPPGRYVMLAITDTGAGMTEEVRSRLFEPFFTTKEPGKGTGLGLATVYGIVKQTGGSIFVYSELGVGTTFKIYLPQVEAEEEPAATGVAPLAGDGSETILLVEDDDRLRMLAFKVLQRYGYTVLTAAGPQEALLTCARHQGMIDMLVADVIMPDMGGKALADRLTVMRPDMSVLFISGYPDEAVNHFGMLPPGSAFLQKPFTPDGLAQAVRRGLDAAQAA